MTTIAYKDGVLAADSRATRGNTIVPGVTPKLHRMSDGSVATSCGTTANGRAFIRWLDAGKEGKAPDLDKGTVIHLQADGKVFEYWDEHPVQTHGPFEAWGSGADFALAAMHLGFNAEDAVKAACKCDTGSAEPVFTMRLELPSPAPAPAAKPNRRAARKPNRKRK